MTCIILGPRTEWLKKHVIEKISETTANVISAEHKRFPDGEKYVRIPIENCSQEKEFLVIHTTDIGRQDEFVWELMLMVNAIVNSGGQKIALYIPYIPYSRQDKQFREGEPVSIEVLLSNLSYQGAKALYTIDIHNPESLVFFKGYSTNILAHEIFLSHNEFPRENVIVISPDKGALHRAKMLAEKIGTEYDYLEKHRDRITGEITMKPKQLDVKNKNIVIVDDIISTGGTIVKASQMLLQQGAENVYVAVSHALMAGNAVEKISQSKIKKVFALNTLPPRKNVEYVDVTGKVIETIRESGIIQL